jgi:transposase
MDIHDRAAGIDISKRDAKACLRLPSVRKGQFSSMITTWASTAAAILKLRSFLEQQHVTTVGHGSGGRLLETVLLRAGGHAAGSAGQLQERPHIPGRKTDVFDAAWLAQLAAHWLLRTSFVPPPPIRELRDLTQTRARLCVTARGRFSG